MTAKKGSGLKEAPTWVRRKAPFPPTPDASCSNAAVKGEGFGKNLTRPFRAP